MAANSRDLREIERLLARADLRPLFEQLVRIVGDIHALRQQMMQLAQMFDAMVENQITISNATQQLQSLSPELQRARRAGMEIARDPSVTGETDHD